MNGVLFCRIFLTSAIIGALLRIFYKYRSFHKINRSQVDDTLKIAERERCKTATRTGIIIILAIIRSFIFFELNNQYGSLGNRLIGIIIMFGFIPLAYYGIQTLFGTIHIAQSTVNKLQNFSLYLRPFDTDNSRQSKWLEKKICISFNNFCKLYAIGNPNTILPPMGAETIYSTDDYWKEAVQTMIKKAKIIILRLGHSSGCQWELRQCFTNKFQYKSIFIATTMDDVYSLQKLFKENNEHFDCPLSINRTIAIYYNTIDSKWQYTSIQKSRDIKQLRSLVKRSNQEYAKLYQCYKEQKRNILKKVKTSEYLPYSVNKSTHCFGFVLNPIIYMYINRWNWKLWIIPILCIISMPILLYTGNILPFAVINLIYIFCSLYAAKISWLSRIWPNPQTFDEECKITIQVMSDYFLIYVIFSVVFFTFLICI